MATDTSLIQQIAELKKLKTGELRKKYLEVFGEETRSSNKAYLFKRIAYRLQEKKYGGLSDPAKRHAEELAKDAPIRRRPDLRGMDATAPASKPARERDPRVPAPGTALKAEHKGTVYTAKVLPDGFEHEGKRYRSLSAIAKEITKCSWNGFAFFNLAKKGE
jgi:hypothetical protein